MPATFRTARDTLGTAAADAPESHRYRRLEIQAGTHAQGATGQRHRPALRRGAERRLSSGLGVAGDDATMQDINAIACYWESELALAGSRETHVPTIATPIGRTWIWSDLHLSDRGPLEAFDRPFADVAAMNRHLLARWRQRVRPGDTIICLGDVAHPDAWRDRRLMLDLRACPGERILILGNHDTDLGALAEAGFGTQHQRALYEAEPTLALSHEPLAAVPVGAVNVHGHLHEGTEPTSRHVNVAVERWNYEPVPMAAVAARALARWK